MVLPDSLASCLELVSVGFAVVYLALAIPQSLWCWPAALVSTALWMVVSFDAKLYMDAGLQVFYFVMGVYGWLQWRRGGKDRAGISVHWWNARTHAFVIALIVLVSLSFGFVLSRSDAAFPYLDSLTTVAAVVATFMVARKVIENWFYWFVIDSVYIYLYIERGLSWYAALYVLYLVMIVFGFLAWQRNVRSERMAVDAAAVS
jgi:nicotinamide mononucleotide transporter